MAKRRLRFGIEALMVLGVVAALTWVGGRMGGPLLASAQDGSDSNKVIADQDIEIAADLIPSGFDGWVTPNNGSSKMTLDFPPGFFCNGLSSELRSQVIRFKGKPFVTDPAGEAGGADTLIERLDPVVFVNGVGTTRLRIVGLSLEGQQAYVVQCPDGATESWTVSVGLDPATPAPIGSMTVRTNATNTGGTFDSDFQVPAVLTFRGPGGQVGTLRHTARMVSRFSPWARIVDVRHWYCRTGYWIDLDGDGLWDIYIEFWRCPGRGGFHPGWLPHPTPGLPGIRVPWDHSAPHPEVWPVCIPNCPPIIIGGGTGSGTGSGTGTASTVTSSVVGVVGN